MSAKKFNPIKEIEAIGESLNKFVDDVQNFFHETGNRFYPRVDISEDDNNIYVEAEFPGMERDEIKLCCNNGIFTLSGEKKKAAESDLRIYHKKERGHGSFARSFEVGFNVDKQNIEAVFSNSLLTVTMPKLEKSESGEIEIEIK